MPSQRERLQNLIDSAQDYRRAERLGLGPAHYGCEVVELRHIAEYDQIEIDAPIVIPSNKSIVLNGGEHSQTRITCIGDFPAIIVQGGHRTAIVRGVLLDGGGIEFQGGCNRFWGLEYSSVIRAKTGVEVSGPSAVNGRVRHVMFRGNRVNVDIRQEQTNLIRFTDCEFLQTRTVIGAGVRIASSNISFDYCAWERSKGIAHVQLFGRDPERDKNRIARSVLFTSPRFGPEGASTGDVPKYVFVIGNDAPSDDTIVGIKCHDGDFSNASTAAIIQQNVPLVNCEFSQINNCVVPKFVEYNVLERSKPKNKNNWIQGERIAQSGWEGWNYW